MSDKMNLFEMLAQYTTNAGSWEISMNDHNDYYIRVGRENIMDHYMAEADEFDGVSTDMPIYRLIWNNNGPVGFYRIFANSLEQMRDKVFEIVCNELKK